MNFIKYRPFYFLISALVLIPGIYSLARWGFVPSIDFTGGSLLEYRIEGESEIKKIKEILQELKINFESVQTSGDQTFLIRGKTIDRQIAQEIKDSLSEKLETEAEEIRFETVGPTLGKELIKKTITAVLSASLAILVYIAWQFKNRKFGICAILAMFHDTLILLGSFSLLGHFLKVEIDTLFVTAVLTTLSFSVHDTVVVFDSFRENQRRHPKASFDSIANKAMAETLIRSLNNSFTIIFMLIALLLLGGATIKWFVAALLIGTIAGTYSSTFIAVPLLTVWESFKNKKKKK